MVAHASIVNAGRADLHLDRMPRATARAFLLCAKLPLCAASQWYLAGGTALALQVGHRQSVDLDFFTPLQKISELSIERDLLATGLWRTKYRESGTIYGELAGAKMSFIAYPFFKPSKDRIRYGRVRLLVPRDIAAMKIIAISQRGRKRDFVDLYWYCVHREPLTAILRRAAAQYPTQEHNLPHILKSLTYFADAEADPMPKLFFTATWKGIQSFFKREVATAARILLRLS